MNITNVTSTLTPIHTATPWITAAMQADIAFVVVLVSVFSILAVVYCMMVTNDEIEEMKDALDNYFDQFKN